MAWNPKKGFYISPVVLDAPWEEELSNIDTVQGKHLNRACLEDRGFDDYLTFLSFKSHDGNPETKPAIAGKGEVPEDFQWTSLYHDNPILKSLIDWFPVEKTRVRLARAAPNGYLKPHFDWDNQRHDFNPDEHQIRIWIQLSEGENWYRFTDGISDINIRLERGQFIILDPDQVIHATENRSDTPRDNIIINAKTNHWVRCVPDLFTKYIKLDPRNSDPQ